MGIKEQILEGLKTRFAGVDENTLNRIATKKSEGVTDESQVKSILDGINFSDVLQSYGDFRAGDAVVSAVRNYEKKYNLKDGKIIETKPIEVKPIEEPLKPDQNNMAAIIADSVKEALKPVYEKLTTFEAEKARSIREEQIIQKAKEYGLPEKYVTRCAIKEDEDLDKYMQDIKQDFSNAGFNVSPPETAEQKIEKENTAIANMINEETEKLTKPK